MNPLVLMGQVQGTTQQWIDLYEKRGAIGVIVILITVVVIYLLMPSMKLWWKRRQEKNQSLDEYIFQRAEKLQSQRDEDLERLRQENKEMRDTIHELEKKISKLMKQSARLDQKLRSFEWLFLIELCDAMGDNIEKNKAEIAKRLTGKTGEELENLIVSEFNRVIADLKTSYVVQQLERDVAKFREDDEEKSTRIHREMHDETSDET